MGEPAKVWKELEFVTETCITCGVIFGMQGEFKEWRLKKHTSFYCPNGHSMCYTSETPEQKLQRELDATKLAVETAKRDAEWQRQLREKAEKKHKREVRKLHVRVGNGVCPCCNRTFSNLARHMGAKHPEFKSEVVA